MPARFQQEGEPSQGSRSVLKNLFVLDKSKGLDLFAGRAWVSRVCRARGRTAMQNQDLHLGLLSEPPVPWPCHAVPCRALPCCAVPWRAAVCRTGRAYPNVKRRFARPCGNLGLL